jgi:hypothetical protein
VKNWLKSVIRSLESAKVCTEETLREKYGHFQRFLDARKKGLALLGLSPPPPRQEILEEIGRAIHFLNVLSEQKYSDLDQILRDIEDGKQEVPAKNQQGSSASGLHVPGFLQPQGCRTFQGLLTWTHNLVIEEMFLLLEKCDVSRVPAKKVKTGLPINLHVIDLEGGLIPGSEGKILPKEQILSLPLQAMFKGMYYPGITWSGPIGINLKGFMVIMAQSTSRPEEDFWDKTYALVSREYMSYNSRLGYHYSSVDAYCSEEADNNHIRFMFKGGAADDLRRALRARFIGGALERIGFAVEVQGDRVNARFLRQTRPEIEAKLDLLGRLMGCSRQRDMVMNDESIVNWYIEAFLKGNYSFSADG